MQYDHYYQQFLAENNYPRNLKSYDERCVNFSSNDYLGLAKHPLLIERSLAFVEKYGVSASSSRLVTGNLFPYAALEKKLAQLIGKPAALILPTGYQTNISVLEAILDRRILKAEPLVLCDRLCHASMIASTRHLTHLYRFQHNDLAHLQQLLEKFAEPARPTFILVESIYSMEGDQTNFPALISLAKKYQACLYVDDAHAFGIYGKSGLGLATDYADEIDIIMGTFSKAGGSVGGYIACSAIMRDYLINKCKGLIYSTGLPPAALGAIEASLELLPHMNEERQRVLNYAKSLRDFFHQHGLDDGGSITHIVPWIIGDAERAIKISQFLEAQGIIATTIRPPSVPTGKSRIRFCLSAAHTPAQIEWLMQAILTVNSSSLIVD